MQTIDREQLQALRQRDENLPVIEVLPRDSYETFHIPGAVNVPLGDADFDRKIEAVAPDKDREVVVYCADTECDASPKAGKRMEQLGYTNVLDYEAGKADWKEAGLPTAAGAEA